MEKTGQRVSHVTAHHECYRQGLKLFHVIENSLKTNIYIEDCKWLAYFVVDWTEKNFLHVVTSDEFYIYVTRKSNHQNNRIFAKNIEHISIDERYREIAHDTKCIDVFIMFIARKLLNALKKYGRSRKRVYFRGIIPQQHVIPFLRSPANVLHANGAIFLHHKALCIKTNPTQHLLED